MLEMHKTSNHSSITCVQYCDLLKPLTSIIILNIVFLVLFLQILNVNNTLVWYTFTRHTWCTILVFKILEFAKSGLDFVMKEKKEKLQEILG